MRMSSDRFEELRKLCSAAGDNASLAVAMVGLVMDHAYQARLRRGIGIGLRGHGRHRVARRSDPGLWGCPSRRFMPRVSALSGLTRCGGRSGSSTSLTVMPTKGNLFIGSPLAVALTMRAHARYCLRPSGLARRPATKPDHGAQRRPVVLRLGRRLRLWRGNTGGRAGCGRSGVARDRGWPYRMPNGPVMISH